jgi:hypothetical protein
MRRVSSLWRSFADALGIAAVEDRSSPEEPEGVIFSCGKRPLRSPLAKG